ncbi:MAG: hypothetical protein FJ100_14005 [Deltaproteobacteria bacterium]|nr:hypothetical protein [Deltaproteobacteria bacterium]
MKNRNWKAALLWSGAAVVLLAGAAWLAWRGPRQRTEADESAANAPGPGRPSAVAVARSENLAALAGTYAWQYTASLRGPAPQGETATAELSAHGDWQAVVLAGQPGWSAVRVAVRGWQANEAMAAATGLQDGAGLAQPFAVRLDDAGKVAEIRFGPTVPAAAQGLLAGVAMGAQFAVAADPAATEWRSDERDPQGRVHANYKRTAPGTVQKTWQGSGSDRQRGEADPLRLAEQAQATFALDRSGIASVQFSRQGTMQPASIDGAGPSTTFRVAFGLKRLAPADASWATRVSVATLQPFDAAALARVAQPRVLPVEFDQAVTALSTRPRTAAHGEMQQRLAVTLAQRPALVDHVDHRLRSGSDDEALQGDLLQALAGAGTARAHKVLGDVLSDEALPQRLRDQTLFAVTAMTHADAGLLQQLVALMQDRKDPAMAAATAVAVGAQARNLEADQPQQAETLRETLRREAAQPGLSLQETCNWLAALGNAADPKALPDILAKLDDPLAEVRTSAAHALRFQDPLAVRDAMALAMANEKDAEVKAALLHAARWMGPAHMQPLVEKALRFDASDAVRLAAAYTVASWSVQAPALRALLATALQTEKAPQVQEALKNYLQPGRIAEPFHAVEAQERAP